MPRPNRPTTRPAVLHGTHFTAHPTSVARNHKGVEHSQMSTVFGPGAARVLHNALAASEAARLAEGLSARPSINDVCPRCVRPGRPKNPDGTCVRRRACDQERRWAIKEGVITKEEPVTEPQTQRLDKRGRPYNAPTGLGSRGANGEEIARVAAERGISLGAARHLVRDRIAAEIASANPVPANQKSKILTNLLAHGKSQTVSELRKRLLKDNFVIDPHNLVHALWAMQKDQHITFRQRRQSPIQWEGDLTAIRLNKNGEAAARRLKAGNPIIKAGEAALAEVRAAAKSLDLPPTTAMISSDVAIERQKIVDQAVKDAPRIGTDRGLEGGNKWGKNAPGRVAPGGPIERITPPRQNERPVEPVVPFSVKVQDNDPKMADVIAEGNRIMGEAKVFLDKVAPEPPIDFFVEFPMIGKMVNRQARIESAAKILEEEGEIELAAQTLERVNYTDFEKEVLRLVKKAVGCTTTSTSRATRTERR
jgi:hypothetical protein